MQMFAILSFLINVTQNLFDEQHALAKLNDKFSPQLNCAFLLNIGPVRQVEVVER